MFRPDRRGFTLLELIVVLVIISLMTALVAPRLTGPMNNLDLKTAGQKIVASLRYARSQAASEKTTYVALFDFDDNRLVIINPPLTMGDFVAGNQLTMERMLTDELDRGKERPGR